MRTFKYALSTVAGLAVLTAIVQAVPPTPRQTPDGPTSAGTANQKQTKTKNNPSESPSAINKNQSEAADSDTVKQEKANAQHSVTISKLPSVTINNRRDWADWGAWFFTFLLAFTGLLQIILLWKTLRVTSKQADIAKQQEMQMIEAGKQTERIIAQMKETEVRDLRAYVGVSKALLNFQNPQKPVAMVEIQNFGKTPAYKVQQWVAITMGPHPVNGVLPDFPSTPSRSVYVISPDIKTVNSAALKKPIPQGTTIGTPEHTIYVYGRVVYEDVFKNAWHTDYRFIFGGPEGGLIYKEGGLNLGAMCPDSEGNDAS